MKRRLAAASVLVAASASTLAMVPTAEAAFSLQPCQGQTVRGQGGSFQNAAQVYFQNLFAGSNGCGGNPTITAYGAGNGSGNGLAAMGAGGGNANLLCASAGCANNPAPAGQRDPSTRFTTIDDPPTPAQQSAMNAGTSSTADDGRIRVIPAVTGAATVIMRAPDGCNLNTVTDRTGQQPNDPTGDSDANNTSRPLIPSARIEQAFAGDAAADTWGELTPGISGTSGATNCTDVPVRRVVRFDQSGTTFAFKSYLNLINGTRGWTGQFASPNTNWPNSPNQGGGPTVVGGTGNAATCATSLCSANASGNGPLQALVNSTSGSIGFNDLATSRANFSSVASTTDRDTRFMLPLQNNPGGTATGYFEPTASPTGHLTNQSTGAACGSVTVQNAPTPANSPENDPTLGDWSRAIAAGGAGYPNCVLSYVLAWDDNAPVYGNTADEQARARTVKDLLNLIVGTQGQALTGTDYSPVPNPLSGYARTGVDRIDWNKTGATGGGTPGGTTPGGTTPGGTNPGGGTPTTPVDDTPPSEPDTTTTPTPIAPPTTPGPGPAPVPPSTTPTQTPTTTGTTPATTPAAPSNRFTVNSGTVNRARTSVAYRVRVPAAGRITAIMSARIGNRTRRIATAARAPRRSGNALVTLRLSSAARSAVRRAGRRGLRVSVRFSYTPTGGTARTTTETLRIRRR